MLIEIEHELRFEYDDFIHESFMELHVEPLTDAHQTLRSFYLAVGPPTQVARYTDWNGNLVHNFGISDYHDRIEILTRSAVSTQENGMGLADLQALPQTPSPDLRGALFDFVAFGGPVERSRELEAFASELRVDEAAPVGTQLGVIGHELFERFEYRRGVTDYRSTTQHVLEEGGGVCQDFAHLMIALLRLRGIPSRYAGGYVHLVTEGSNSASESHAWVEAYIPDHGWVGYDPTHDRVPDEHYVLVSRGRHYDDVAPNRGIYRGDADEKLHTAVTTRIAPPKDVASLQEEIGQLDVPVFREQPRPLGSGSELEPEAQQQQQQQQQ